MSAPNRALLGRAWRHYSLSDDEGLRTIGKRLQRDGRIDSWDSFVRIVGWKAPRVKGLIQRRHERKLRIASQHAFELADRGEILEAIEALNDARVTGVNTRMASAILMFHSPRKFTVMDVKAWKALVYLGRLSPFTGYERPGDYPAYLEACRGLALELHWGLRDTDRALWIIGDHAGDVPTDGRRGCPHCT